MNHISKTTANGAVAFCLMMVPLLGAGFPGLPQNEARPVSTIRERWPDGLLKWTPRDSIGVRYYGQADNAFEEPPLNPIVPSQDGKFFYLISSNGDLAADRRTMRIDVYDAERVRTWFSDPGSRVSPVCSVEMRTHRTYISPISGVKWETRGAGEWELWFMGTDGNDQPQIYCLNVSSGALQARSDDPYDKHMFSGNGNTAIYRRLIPRPTVETPYPAIPIQRAFNGEVLLPSSGAQRKDPQWVARMGEGTEWILPVGAVTIMRVVYAPGGRYAILNPIQNYTGSATHVLRGSVDYWLLADFERKEIRQLAEARLPVKTQGSGFQSRAFWSDDGQHVVLDFAARLGDSTPSSKATADLLDINIGTGKSRVLESKVSQIPGSDTEREISDVKWMEVGKRLMVSHESAGRTVEGTVYNFHNGEWTATPAADSILAVRKIEAPLPGGMKVVVREAANHPSEIVVVVGEHEKVLSVPDMALDGIWRAPVEPFLWRTGSGEKLTGGLSLPQGFDKRKPVPLVIQLYSYLPKQFLPDGFTSSAFAMQSLVSQGMAVLQMNIMDMRGINMEGEQQEIIERIDSAVEELARRSIVNPARVGLVGFSHSGYDIFYAITHPGRIKICAAEFADSVNYTLSDLTYNAVLNPQGQANTRRAPEDMNGGDFWANKATWLKRDLIFNLDRMKTPLLMIAIHDGGISSKDYAGASTMLYGALQLNHLPFDVLSIPTGIHNLNMPRERLASMEATVDWMNFWLRDVKSSASEKSVQNSTWDLIRYQWEARMARDESAGSVTARLAALGIPAAASSSDAMNEIGLRLLYSALGWRGDSSGDAPEALKVLRLNVEMHPSDPQIGKLYGSLGEAYLQLGEWEEATANYSKAVEVDPSLTAEKAVLATLQENRHVLVFRQFDRELDYRFRKAKENTENRTPVDFNFLFARVQAFLECEPQPAEAVARVKELLELAAHANLEAEKTIVQDLWDCPIPAVQALARAARFADQNK